MMVVLVVMVMAVMNRLGCGVGRVMVMMRMMVVMMPSVQRGGAGDHTVVERFHARTDTPGDRSFLTTGRTQQSKKRLQERHTRNLLITGGPRERLETLPGSGYWCDRLSMSAGAFRRGPSPGPRIWQQMALFVG
jgi:hypothetical protein